MSKHKKTIEKIIQSLLEMKAMTMEDFLNGRKKAREYGLEKIFDEELDKIKKRMPYISFKEMAILRMDGLSKQPPVTLEEARAQVMWLRYGQGTGETIEMFLEKYTRGEFDFIYKQYDEKK